MTDATIPARPRSKAAKPSLALPDVLARVAAGQWKRRDQSALEKLPEAARTDIYRGAWDAFTAGTFGVDTSAGSYRDQAEFLEMGVRATPGLLSHGHVAHAMDTLDEEGRHVLGIVVVNAMMDLPPSADDAIVAGSMDAYWLDVLAFWRFVRGARGVWQRGLFPQPGFDDASRRYLIAPTSIFAGNFADATRLLAGRPELAAVLARHYGEGALVRSHALVQQQSLEAEARDAALAPLIEFEPFGAQVAGFTDHNTRRMLALAFAVLFREAPAELPAIVLDSLAHGGGTSRAVMSDADKDLLRTSSATLEPDARALVVANFYL